MMADDGRQCAATREHSNAESTLRDGLTAGEVGVWRWDIGSDALFWSDNMEAIHHVPTGSFDGTFESFARDIHPDDAERVLAAVRKVVAEGRHIKRDAIAERFRAVMQELIAG